MRRNTLLSTAAVALTVFLSPLSAIERSRNTMGDVSIVPVFSTHNGLDTLLKVSNVGQQYDPGGAATEPVPVKVLVHDDLGAVIASFSIYLGKEDTWAGVITGDSPGNSVLRSADSTCLLGGQEEVRPITEINIPAVAGYLTLFEMGRIGEDVLASAFQLNSDGICQRLADEWNTGIWETDSSTDMRLGLDEIEAFATLVNVQSGTMFDIPTTALRGFSGQITHFRPGDELPNLSAPTRLEGEDSFTSVICPTTGAPCQTYAIDEPVNAVAVALLASGHTGDFNQEAALDATTEWVVLNPLNPYFAEARRDDGLGLVSPYIPTGSLVPRTGFAIDSRSIDFETLLDTLVELRFDQPFDFANYLEARTQYAIVFLNDQPQVTLQSDLVGIPSANVLAIENFRGRENYGDSNGTLQMASGRFASASLSYDAFPKIVVGLQQFKNGTLVSPSGESVLSNYGRSAAVEYYLGDE